MKSTIQNRQRRFWDTHISGPFTGAGGTAAGCKHCNHVEKSDRRDRGAREIVRGAIIRHIKQHHPDIHAGGEQTHEIIQSKRT